MKTTTKSTLPAKSPVAELTSLFAKQLAAGVEFTIKTREDYDHAAVVLSAVHGAEKTIENRYEAIYRPIKTGLDQLAKEFKPLKDKVKLAKSNITAAMAQFVRAEQAKQQAQIQKVLIDKRMKEETKQEKLAVIESAPAFSNTRKQLVLVVTDVTKIPREFFDLNESKLKNYLKDGATVAGAYVEYQDVIVAR